LQQRTVAAFKQQAKKIEDERITYYENVYKHRSDVDNLKAGQYSTLAKKYLTKETFKLYQQICDKRSVDEWRILPSWLIQQFNEKKRNRKLLDKMTKDIPPPGSVVSTDNILVPLSRLLSNLLPSVSIPIPIQDDK